MQVYVGICKYMYAYEVYVRLCKHMEVNVGICK